jgi:protein-L-isoaspartate(D-aspartate) O-methyltransferase
VSPLRITLGGGSRLKPPGQKLADELRAQGIRSEAVLAAVARIPRHLFVDEALRLRAYEKDSALPIGFAQTISQVGIVALMTEVLLEGLSCRRVLEIGTELVSVVFTVERIRPLSEAARKRLAALGYKNIHYGYADGMNGWLPYAPYDAILVTAGAAEVPPALPEQLAPGGRLVIPVGPQGRQSLRVIERTADGRLNSRDIAAVSFVPLLAGRV